jgi:hypothetical protein
MEDFIYVRQDINGQRYTRKLMSVFMVTMAMVFKWGSVYCASEKSDPPTSIGKGAGILFWKFKVGP